MAHDVQLDLDLLVPDAHSPADHCVDNLVAALDALPGVRAVHVEGHEVCLHVEPGLVSVPRLVERARAVGAEISGRYGHALWPVAGITHATRAERLGALLRRAPGVVDAEVSVEGFARVEFDRTVVDEDGVRREVLHLAGHREEHDHAHEHAHGARWELGVAGAAFAAYVVARLTGWTALDVGAAVATAAVVGRDVVQALRARHFDIELLMFVAAAGAAALGHWSDAALLLALFVLGHGLEGHAMARARREIEGLADLTPSIAHRVRRTGEGRGGEGGAEEEGRAGEGGAVAAGVPIAWDGDAAEDVPVDDLAAGDVVVVRPGERVPADGTVRTGATSVDESAVTGESMPVDKEPGRPVFAGTTNGAGAVEVEVTRPAADSTLARVVRLVAEAEVQAAPSQLLTRRIVAVFVPAVLVLVAGLLVVPPLAGERFQDSFLRAMAVLVASSPCALAIATPSAVLAAIARAARSGVLVKGGAPLEALGRVRTLCFDKTGTLTEGRPRLVDVVPVAGVERAALLAAAVSVESMSDHPLARAVVAASPPAPPAAGGRAVHGKGMVSDDVWAGNAALFGDEVPAEVEAIRDRLEAAGRTTILVRRGDGWLGVLGLMDEPRPEAAATVAALRTLGVEHVAVLSGDQERVVAAVADAVGIVDARGGLLPEGKVDAVRSLGPGVAMVGDGVNDAPALATATVGIAMGAAGSHTALETADVALLADRLDRLPFAVGLARRATATVRQNLVFSLAVVAVLIPLTITGVGIGPAVVAHEGSTVVVVANALLLLRWREPRPRPNRV